MPHTQSTSKAKPFQYGNTGIIIWDKGNVHKSKIPNTFCGGFCSGQVYYMVSLVLREVVLLGYINW